MTFRGWFRRRAACPPPISLTPVADPRKALCLHVFERILAAAAAIHIGRSIDRSDILFDTHVGSWLADRAIEARDDPETLRLTTAILLSHCGYDAALMFVVKLTDRGRVFGVTVAPDASIRCDQPEKRAFGTADIYCMAERCAQDGGCAREAGPFRGPAQMLWDAGYAGAAPTSPHVERAATELARRVMGTWDHILPPEQDSPG